MAPPPKTKKVIRLPGPEFAPAPPFRDDIARLIRDLSRLLEMRTLDPRQAGDAHALRDGAAAVRDAVAAGRADEAAGFAYDLAF
jgi:hypothetical protein